MTAFQRDFWRRKARHMQVVFFMRVGAFYELYDVRSSHRQVTLNSSCGWVALGRKLSSVLCCVPYRQMPGL